MKFVHVVFEIKNKIHTFRLLNDNLRVDIFHTGRIDQNALCTKRAIFHAINFGDYKYERHIVSCFPFCN